MKNKFVPARLSRRESLGWFAILGGAVLAGCSSALSANDGGGGGGATGTDGGADTGATGTDGGSGTWAQGGTKSMKGPYADPFVAPVTACVLATAATEGPCTEAADQVRADISEGYTGLPTRLALKVVDAACKPVMGAKVKVWHTQITGSYSGDTPNAGMCLKSPAEGTKHYFRGVQTTNQEGRVDFDTCFPGWYRGRAIHIHYTVTANGKSFTSQLLFDQALIQEVFSTHPEYKGFGQPDTPNASDNVVRGGDLASFTLAASRLPDGALMAAKVLVANV
ncbi:MAG: hypothetical protein IPF92_07185 [Myxococcales bacterium]|nr:hypothetical protein [Myxococcales bacterium]